MDAEKHERSQLRESTIWAFRDRVTAHHQEQWQELRGPVVKVHDDLLIKGNGALVASSLLSPAPSCKGHTTPPGLLSSCFLKTALEHIVILRTRSLTQTFPNTFLHEQAHIQHRHQRTTHTACS